MIIIDLLFIYFSFSLILSALMVVVSKNSVHSVLFLVLSFISASSLLFLLECEFISLLFIIIYVGAIAVLFLFVVMMLDIKTLNHSKDALKYLPFGSFIGFVLLLEILLGVYSNFSTNPYKFSFLSNFYTNWLDKIDYLTEIEAVGQIMYTYYVLQFLIAGIILLLSVIGAVVLSLRISKQTKKKQIVFRQLARTYKNSLFIYKK